MAAPALHWPLPKHRQGLIPYPREPLMVSLRRKIAVGFGGLLLILIVVAAISVRVLGAYSHTLDTLFHENYDSALFCDAMKDSLDELNNQAQRSLWQPGDPSAQQTQ